MDKFKKILRKIFFLPPLPTVIIAAFGYAFVLVIAAFNIEIPALQYLSYIASAYALTLTVTGFPYLISFVKNTKQRVVESSAAKKKFTIQNMEDDISRTFISARNCRCILDCLSISCTSQ